MLRHPKRPDKRLDKRLDKRPDKTMISSITVNTYLRELIFYNYNDINDL